MRRFVAVTAAAVTASACAMIAGLGEPSDLDPTNALPDSATTPDGATSDAATGTTDGGAGDADAGRACTGPILKSDTFDDRPAADLGWDRDYRGDSGLIEAKNGVLHIVVPPAVSGQNLRRLLGATKNAAKHMCVSYTAQVAKPQNTTAYFDSGDTTFGFIHVTGPDGGVEYYEGIGFEARGTTAYVFRSGPDDDVRPIAVPITTKWSVYIDADFVADKLTIAVNGREETFTMMRPAQSPSATFLLGVRNYGPAPEAEAFFDDVVITAE